MSGDWMRVLLVWLLLPAFAGRAYAGEAAESGGAVLLVRMTAAKYAWTVRYAGPDHLLDTADDRVTTGHPHFPVSSRIRIVLESDDLIYSLHLPEYNLKQIAVPHLKHPLEFETRDEGVFVFLGDQFCGFSHASLNGTCVVESAESFARWFGQEDDEAAKPERTPYRQIVMDALAEFRRAKKPANP